MNLAGHLLKRKRMFKRYHLYAVMLNVASFYLFTKMVEDLIDGEAITRFDIWLNQHMVLIWNPALTTAARAVTAFGGVWVLLVASALVLIILVKKKRWHPALLLFFGMSGGFILVSLIKLITHRARPALSLISETGYSFPSAHTTMATIFFALLLYSFRDDIKNRALRIMFYVATVGAFILVGFSRLYLGVHWLSDVIAGFSLGIFWLTLLILVFRIIAEDFSRIIQKAKHYLATL